jgi:phosphohistidine phosphatase SixA
VKLIGMNLQSTNAARGRSSWSALLFILLASCACAGQTAKADAKPERPDAADFKVTTVFLVRHAEKADVPGADPPLSEAGKSRAEALARLLQSAGVKAVYTSQYLRTQQTAEPIARRLGITSVSVPLSVKTSNPREVTDESIRELTKRVEANAGGAVLIVGHSNSIPEVIRMLGGDLVPKIDESRFDDLFVVTVYPGGRAKVVRLKYGSTD